MLHCWKLCNYWCLMLLLVILLETLELCKSRIKGGNGIGHVRKVEEAEHK